MKIRSLLVFLVMLTALAVPSFAEGCHGCPNSNGGTVCSEEARIQLNAIQLLLQKTSGSKRSDAIDYLIKVNDLAQKITLKEQCNKMWENFITNVSQCKFSLIQKDKAGVDAYWSMVVDTFKSVYMNEVGVQLDGNLRPL